MRKNLKNMKYLPAVIFVASMLAAVTAVTAQSPQDNGYNAKMDLIAPYQPTISDAFKINVNPVIKDTVMTMPKVTYSVLPRQMKTSFTPDPIKPAKVGEPTLTKLYRFLAKGGFGTYTTPYGEFFANNTYSKSFSMGAHYKHLSSSGKLKGYGYQGYSDNVLDFYGRKFLPSHTLSGGIGYQRNVVHYYGYKPADFISTLSKNDIKQRYQAVIANFRLTSLYPPDSVKFNHDIGMNYYYYNDRYGASENNFRIKGNVNKELGLFKITKSQVLGVDADIDYYFNQDSLTNGNSGLIMLQPYIRTTFKGVMLHAGLNLSVEAASTSKMHLYPIVDAQFNVVKNILVVFAGIKGDMQKNSFRSLSTENPFVISTVPVGFSNNKFDVFGGIKSSISRTMNFNAVASYSRVKDMPFFINDTNNIYKNMFTVITDDVSLINIRGEFAYQKDDKYKLLLGGNFYNYTMDKELKPWHKPVFDAYLTFMYNIGDKFIINADITGRSDVWAKNYTAVSVVPKKLNGYADVSLGIEYRYTKILSAFLNLNNLLTTKYQEWNNYPTQGFNLLGGVTYAF
ncbi:MAG: hypothetical protein WCM76_07180 [Bacteroidota bacterium]